MFLFAFFIIDYRSAINGKFNRFDGNKEKKSQPHMTFVRGNSFQILEVDERIFIAIHQNWYQIGEKKSIYALIQNENNCDKN